MEGDWDWERLHDAPLAQARLLSRPTGRWSERQGVMQCSRETTRAFLLCSLSELKQGQDLPWTNLLPQCSLALVGRPGWSLVVVVMGPMGGQVGAKSAGAERVAARRQAPILPL